MPMKSRIRVLLLCLLMAACATQPKPGQESLVSIIRNPYRLYDSPQAPMVVPFAFDGYHAYFLRYSHFIKWPNLPHELEGRWRACIVDYSLSHFTDQEFAELAEFTQAHKKMTVGEVSAFHEKMAARAGPTDADLLRDVSIYCPDTVRDITPYVESGAYITVMGWAW